MASIFVLLLTASLILMIIGLIKPKVFSRKGNVPPTRGKIALVFTGLSLLFFILIGVTAPENEQANTQKENPITDSNKETPNLDEEQNPEEKKESKTNEEDIKKLAAFHKELVATERLLEIAVEDFNKVIQAKYPDRYEIYEAADNLYKVAESTYLQTQKINAPILENKNAEKSSQKALEALQYYILAKHTAAGKFRDVADSGNFRPSVASAIKSSGELSDTSAMMFGASIARAYDELGIPLSKVDVKNGGLEP